LSLILAICWWAISQLPLPEPFRWVAIILIALIAILLLLHLLPVADLRLPVR
jgi:hypothetical protein